MREFYFSAFIFFTIGVLAQQPECPPKPQANVEQFCEEGKGIKTNPDDLHNPECSDLKNNFDWRVQNAGATEFYPAVGPGGDNFNIRNPFTGPIDAHYAPYISASQGSNYNPEDGWELLKVEFGTYGNIDANNISGWHSNMPNSQEPKLPYMMLYNKFTGTLRFFGSLLEPHNTYKTVEIELRIPVQSPPTQVGGPPTGNNYQSDLKATNLLSIQGKAMQPLDQETDESAMSVFVPYNNNSATFFWFDVPLAYDPCVCNNRAQLDVSFKFVQEADVEIEGDINGSINTQSNGSVNYGVMAFNRILAVGISTAAAIKTGGAVINFKSFVGLIDIFKNHPSTSEAQKESLETFQNILYCVSDFAKVIRDNYSDLDDNKKKIKAANKILDANTTFLSSYTSGCNTKDNAALTITGKIKASGTVTQTDLITDTRIALALPGSDWSDFTMKSNNYFQSDGKVVPAYPTYDERLGVFALLETPKVKLQELDIYNHSDLTTIYRISLLEDLKYAFNPKVNLDLEKSIISCRYVLRADLGQFPFNHWEPFNYYQETWKDVNYWVEYSYDNLYPISSSFVPIEYLKKMPMIFAGNGLYNSGERVYLQFKILLSSNNIGLNGQNNEAYHVFTLPVDIEEEFFEASHYNTYQPENTIISNLLDNHLMFDDLSHLSFYDDDITFDTDITFYDDKIIYSNGFVDIKAKLKTANGSKVKIYSRMGIRVLDGAEIKPNIDLLIDGYPFEEHPMPPVSFTQLSDFCSSNNYKAQHFSTQAKIAEQKEYQRQSELLKLQNQLTLTIHPNPSNGKFTLAFSDNLTPNSKLIINSINGEIIYQKNLDINKDIYTINVPHLNKGMYFISIETSLKKISRKLMIN